MTARLDARLAALKQQDRTGLITFIMAGDPDARATTSLLARLPAHGADIIELGVPFSDPMADGPTIEAAGHRALAAGMNLPQVLELVRGFRKTDSDTPLILMGYYNPVYRYGAERFASDAVEAGVDGVILVDIALEEQKEVFPLLQARGLACVPLIAPTTAPERQRALAESGSGFAYYVSVAGITGTKQAEQGSLEQALARLKAQCRLPLAVGFGIRSPEQATALKGHADAVVVGSAIVEANHREGPDAALALVKSLSAALA